MTPKNKQNNRLPLRWKKYADGDIFIPVLTFLLAAFGVLAVYSASSYVAQKQSGDALYFVKKQLIGLVLGTACMLFLGVFNCQKLHNKKVRLFALIIYPLPAWIP